MAEIAATNAWEGLTINGAARDTALLGLPRHRRQGAGHQPPQEPQARAGKQNVVVAFGGGIFTPGSHVVTHPVVPDSAPGALRLRDPFDRVDLADDRLGARV
jgi:regulator of ribonuclease activity A